jgi:hypothetical protein
VAASAKHKLAGTKDNLRTKNLARMKLQAEAMKFSADFLEQITNVLDGGVNKRACAPGVRQLRESADLLSKFLSDANKA